MERRDYCKIQLDEEEYVNRQHRSQVELRRRKRFEKACKHRILERNQPLALDIPVPPRCVQTALPALMSDIGSQQTAQIIIDHLMTGELDKHVLLNAIKWLRQCTNTETRVVNMLFDLGAVDVFLKYFCLDWSPKVVIQASWGLCNMASGSLACTDYIVSSGGLNRFYEGLQASELFVVENSICGITNVMVDRQEHRVAFLEGNLQELCVATAQRVDTATITAKVARCLFTVLKWSMVRAREASMVYAPHLLDAVDRLYQINREADAKTTAHYLNALAVLTKAGDEMTQLVVDRELVPTALAWISNIESESVRRAGALFLQTMASGSFQCINLLVHLDVLDILQQLIVHDKAGVRKAAYKTLARLTASHEDVKISFLQHQISRVMTQGICDSSEAVALSASSVVQNIVSTGTQDQVLGIYKLGLDDHLQSALEKGSDKVVLSLLQTIDHLLGLETGFGQFQSTLFLPAMEENGTLDTIYDTLGRSNAEVSQKAEEILSRYISGAQVCYEGQMTSNMELEWTP